MPSIWMDVDAALAEVPVNIMPLLDSTDFVTREVAITYNQAGMDLVWNFCTTAGAMTQTAVTPTTGGLHDWAHQGDGIYTLEIPASGGTINNDTEGFGWFTGFATGVLPWRGPIIGFRAAALNDLLIDSAYSATRGLAGTALPDAVADAAGGLAISDAGGLALDDIPITAEFEARTLPSADYVVVGDTIAGVTTVGTVTTLTGHTPQTGDSFARIGAAGASLTDLGGMSDGMKAEVEAEANDALVALNVDHLAKEPTAAADMTTEIVDNTILSRVLANGDTSAFVPSTDGLQLIRDKETDIETDTAVIGALGAGLTGVPWNATWDAEVQSEVADALTAYDPPTKTEMDTAHALLATPANVATELATYDGPTKAEMDTAHGLLTTPAQVATALTTYDAPTKAEMDTAHGLLATPTQVNAQVLDVLNVDTFAEPGQGAPTATTSLAAKIGYLYKAFRNKLTQTATTLSILNDAGDTVDQKSTVSDDGTTYTRGEIGSGP